MPVRQRHRRTDHAGRGRPGWVDRQAPPDAPGISRAPRRSAIRSRPAPRGCASACGRKAARRPAPAPRSSADDGTAAGMVTSGGFCADAEAPIAMGYVRRDLADRRHALDLMVRGKPQTAVVAPAAFRPPPLHPLEEGSCAQPKTGSKPDTPGTMNGCGSTATSPPSASPITRRSSSATSCSSNCRRWTVRWRRPRPRGGRERQGGIRHVCAARRQDRRDQPGAWSRTRAGEPEAEGDGWLFRHRTRRPGNFRRADG